MTRSIIGISPDKPAKLKKFDDKYGLGFTLVSDLEHEIAEKYGVWVLKKNYGKEYMGVQRSAFLVDEHGKIDQGVAKDQPEGHADQPARCARRGLNHLRERAGWLRAGAATSSRRAVVERWLRTIAACTTALRS